MTVRLPDPLPSPVFVGFFPKHTERDTESLGNPVVVEICSVSNCISSAPEGWVEQWSHNDHGFYDSESIALDVAAADAATEPYEIYAYRLFPIRCGVEETKVLDLAPVGGENVPADYEFLGYDVVSSSVSSLFECSPLSCNYAAQEFKVNRHCLLPDIESATDALVRITNLGTYEPGPYFLFEVHRKKRQA